MDMSTGPTTTPPPHDAVAFAPLPALRVQGSASASAPSEGEASIVAATIRDVVNESGHRVFVVDVSTRGALEDLVQVKRRFTDFWQLRHELLYLVQKVHRSHKQPCAFCAGVAATLTDGAPRLHQRVLRGSDTLRTQLQGFLDIVVALAGKANSGSAIARVCKGQSVVVSLVTRFLSTPEESTESGSTPSGWVYTVSW